MNSTIKQAAHQLIDSLPETVTWRDILRALQVRKEIEEGIKDANAGRVVDISDIRAEFGIRT